MGLSGKFHSLEEPWDKHVEPTHTHRLKLDFRGKNVPRASFEHSSFLANTQGLFTPWTMKLSRGPIKFVIGC